MDMSTDFTWKTALQVANHLVFQHTGQYLSDLEIIVLQGAWNNQTYEQIAEAKGYTTSYLCRDVGCKLWGNLSTAMQERVSKKNFKGALQREWRHYTDSNLFRSSTIKQATFGGESTALNSTFYLERSPIESICYETIFKSGSLIRIKGAKWMGKTSLIKQILEQVKLQAQRTVYLDFTNIDRKIISDSSKLCCWLTKTISRQLELNGKFPYHPSTGSIELKNNCTDYFEKHILAEINSELVLALDNIDRLFVNEPVGKDFFTLLHSWHHKSQTHPLWSKLKLIFSHSTKAHIPIDINSTSLSAGLSILLRDFNYQQVETLASLYQLNCDQQQIKRLMDEVGGHPYLLKLAMSQMKAKNSTIG